MKKIILPVIVFAIVASSCGNKVFRTAEKHYQSYEFAAAARMYETVLKSDTGNVPAMLHLADCYRNMNRHHEAETWYSKSVTREEATPADKKNYADVLRENGKYSEAARWYSEYLKTDPGNLAVMNSLNSCDKTGDLSQSNPFYEVKLVDVQGHGSVFSPFVSGDKVMVAADAPLTAKDKPSNWTGKGYLDLFYLDEKAPGGVTPVEGVNSELNDGPGVISNDGRFLYFTRNFIVEGDPTKANDNDNHLEICVAEKQSDGKWGNVKSVPFNNPEYSCGHPALTKDGMRMFFTSDMPGGFGGTDIYYSDFSNGEWGKPVNVGECINTNGNEMFPSVNTVHAGHERVFFSTDGWPGLGGLDIYASDIENGVCKKAERVELPFNSTADDFGITYNSDGKSGYFSSNRESADGSDRVYSFRKLDPKYYVKVEIADKEKSTPIANAPIEMVNSRTGEKTNLVSGIDGTIFMPADSMTNYAFTVRPEGYFVGFGAVNTGGFHGQFFDTSFVTLKVEQIVLNKPIRLDNIYYDYNKADIRPDAAIELDKLVKIMKDNPAITIELSSHTDCRGSDAYNEKLSHRRAVSAVNYIISKGIDAKRITAKGYGEKQLLNKCDDGVKCTEEEHQWNRRTEFKVTHIAVPDRNP